MLLQFCVQAVLMHKGPPLEAIHTRYSFTVRGQTSWCHEAVAFQRFAALTGLGRSMFDLSCIGDGASTLVACSALQQLIFTTTSALHVQGSAKRILSYCSAQLS